MLPPRNAAFRLIGTFQNRLAEEPCVTRRARSGRRSCRCDRHHVEVGVEAGDGFDLVAEEVAELQVEDA
mgnify:CR=1 FL=1